MVNQYETVFILTPVLSDTQVKEAVQKYVGFLKENGAEIVHQEDWGLKKLAYPIQKKSSGFYSLLEFKAEGEVIEKLETSYRRDEMIIRFLTFKMDKFAVAYSIKRRKNRKEATEEKKED
ncbi:MAG: 30S ribosomal protein S6 [Bacteroidetes bacterium]|jgi:small subunit ribosomal protein S6|nr:30S ribosomal protein S6 [Bacteroidota bacterium]MBT6686574.1 30S ribosomal protein S6 [Bacteroidota bacterium]MBT7142937.1 30S ribosomal protein S6 [Bacteroidota bacterium]MBT7490614.1 30S ribosomal protein S6 [Bacteroidota bacterium]